MPLISPIDEVLQETGLKRKSPSSKSELKELLNDHNLGPTEVLDSLANLMQYADTSATKLQATKIAAEMNGILSTEASRIIPTVNIIINDNEYHINPILVPRITT